MEANAGDFHESRRKTRNNSRDADQRRHTNKPAPTQQAMVRPNRLQATVLINYSPSPFISVFLLRSFTGNDAVDVKEFDGNTQEQNAAFCTSDVR
jgi:hypothetical protein